MCTGVCIYTVHSTDVISVYYREGLQDQQELCAKLLFQLPFTAEELKRDALSLPRSRSMDFNTFLKISILFRTVLLMLAKMQCTLFKNLQYSEHHLFLSCNASLMVQIYSTQHWHTNAMAFSLFFLYSPALSVHFVERRGRRGRPVERHSCFNVLCHTHTRNDNPLLHLFCQVLCTLFLQHPFRTFSVRQLCSM